MARIGFGSGQPTVYPIAQTVWVNRWGDWRLDPYVRCVSTTQGLGTSATTGQFVIPALRWDEAGDAYAGAEVLVYAGESGYPGTGAAPCFHGWIQSESAALDKATNRYSFSALSILLMLDKVPVGLKHWTVKDWDGTNIRPRTRRGLGARYPRWSAMRGGRRTILWDPLEVLKDVFAGLPTYWASAVRLGDTAVFRDAPYKTKGLVEWDFSAASVLDALETIVGSYGDITYVERFNGQTVPRVELDFFEIQHKQQGGSKLISIPTLCDEASLSRFNVKAIGRTDEHADVVDRILLAGAPMETMISVWTGDPDPSRRLRPAWENPQITRSETFWDGEQEQSIAVTKTAEEWVLDDPSCGDCASENYIPQCHFVFRRYKLPPCLIAPTLSIAEDNAVYAAQGAVEEDQRKRLEQQAFRTRLAYRSRAPEVEMGQWALARGLLYEIYGYTCDYVYGDSGAAYEYGYGYWSAQGWRLLNFARVDLIGELIEDSPDEGVTVHPLEPVSGFEVSADGTVYFDEPQTVVIYQHYCGSKQVTIRAQADVVVTVTVRHEDRVSVDTGQPPYRDGRTALIGKDGLCWSKVQDDWIYAQVTNLGNGPPVDSVPTNFEFIDPETGAPVLFGWCVYQDVFDPDADDPTLPQFTGNEQQMLRHVFAQEVIRDDSGTMRELARRLLKLKMRPRRAFEVTIPVATNAYQAGDSVRFEGAQNIPADTYAVTGLTISLDPIGGDHNTRLTIDNSVPEESIHMEW